MPSLRSPVEWRNRPEADIYFDPIGVTGQAGTARRFSWHQLSDTPQGDPDPESLIQLRIRTIGAATLPSNQAPLPRHGPPGGPQFQSGIGAESSSASVPD